MPRCGCRVALPASWRSDAAQAYLDVLRDHGLTLGASGGLLYLPDGHTRAEAELVRMLKPELLALMNKESRHDLE